MNLELHEVVDSLVKGKHENAKAGSYFYSEHKLKPSDVTVDVAGINLG